MSQIFPSEEKLKEIFKQAVLEMFEEQKDVLYDLIAEIIEDIALANAIKEGEASEPVSKAEIFSILVHQGVSSWIVRSDRFSGATHGNG